MEGVDAIVNLAGENLAERRWTAARKEALDRVGCCRRGRWRVPLPPAPTRRACSSARPPSATTDRMAMNPSQKHTGRVRFSRAHCVDWEQEARAAVTADEPGHSRSAVALGDGGALKKMLLPFKLGGGDDGIGRAFFPWIHADDWTRW